MSVIRNLYGQNMTKPAYEYEMTTDYKEIESHLKKYMNAHGLELLTCSIEGGKIKMFGASGCWKLEDFEKIKVL